MFKNEMGFTNKVKKFFGLKYCIVQKYFIDAKDAQEYFEDCCKKFDDKKYDTWIQHNLAYDRYQVVVEKKRGA